MEWKKTISEITKDNGAIKSLKDLIIDTVYKDESLKSTFSIIYNAKNGGHLGWRGAMEDVGWAGAACNPTYKKAKTNIAEKVWSLGDWSIPLEFCFKDYEDTIAEYALKTGTDIYDLNDTDIMKLLIVDPLTDAMNKMLWRITWFGDKNANTPTLTSGVDKTLFNMTDGLFKQIFALGASKAEQRVTIAANNGESTAAQMEGIKGSRIAIGIFDSLIDAADTRLFSNGGAILCTNSLAKALDNDVMRQYHDRLEWKQIEGGVRMTEYNGVQVRAIGVWDRMIAEYQNNGTKLNLPHRAVFASTNDLLVGTPANDILSDVTIGLDEKQRTTYIYSAGKIGTLLGEDSLINMAY